MNRPHYAVIETARMQGSGEDMVFSFRIGSEYEGAPVGRFRISATDSEYPEVIPEEIAAILRTAAADHTANDAAALTKYFVTHPVERRLASQEVAKLEAKRRAIENKIPSTMVMSEMAGSRDTFVLVHGAYDEPGEKVTPAVPLTKRASVRIGLGSQIFPTSKNSSTPCRRTKSTSVRRPKSSPSPNNFSTSPTRIIVSPTR